MTKPELLNVKVVETRSLTADERILLEELKARQQSTLNNIRTAFQYLITLSVSLTGLQISILTFINFQLPSPLTRESWLILCAFGLLFGSVVISFIGQISGVLHLPTLDTLETYRTFREGRIKRSYLFYVSANLLFIGGFALFIIGFIVMTR